MKRILLFIRSLNAGGAERQVVETAKGLVERGYNVNILTFYDGGFYADELLGTDVNVLSLHKKGRWDIIVFLFRLWKTLRFQSPDVLYSFLGTANILSVAMRPFIKSLQVVWGVRASNMDLGQYDWLSRWSYRLECGLAGFADVIVANSNAGREYAVAHGFPREKTVVIPNGIDTGKFRPDRRAGKKLRVVWGVAENEKVIGVVGRIDPMKGIPTFLEAATLLKKRYSKLHFVWVGEGESVYKNSMKQLSNQLGLDDVMIWAGQHTDMLAVYNAFDINSSPSYSEGFPNVVIEAMACGVPCVVTDVGDSPLIVSDTGIVVPERDSHALASALDKMLLLDKSTLEQLSNAARQRIVKHFSMQFLLNRTEKILIEGKW